MSVLHLDWETRSTVDLPNTGAYVYAQHPDTDIWCGAWAFDDEDPQIWAPGMPVPARIIEHVAAGGEIRAHNAAFERLIWQYIAGPRYGWPTPRLEQFVCSAAEAAAMSLPRNLDGLGKALGLTQQKDEEGYRLMLRMSRPRKIHPDGRIEWWDVPDRIARLHEYCEQDIVTERAAEKCLRRLTSREREIYLLDQRMNDRGVMIDRPLIVAAIDVAAEGVQRANGQLELVTGGAVDAVTNHGALRAWVREQGVETTSVAKARTAELLEGELPAAVREALTLRADAGRSSIAKLTPMLDHACGDDRMRGLLLYHGASTGRWTGRGPQPQNYPRGEVKDVELFIPAILARDYDAVDLIAHPIVVVSSLLRGMLRAAPGRDLIAGDFSAIEARVLNWLAGQEDVLDSFRAYDAGDKSQDPYKRMAVRMGRAARVEDVTKDGRQAGKAAELGCGFGMGWEKFIAAAWQVYQVRVNEAESKSAVAIYRETHPMVKEYWYELENAATHAVANPGVVNSVGPGRNVKLSARGAYLYLVLPSGRPLCYPAPKLVERETPWGTVKEQLEYSAVHPISKQWVRERTYGGKLTENVVQAVARDLMADALLRLEARGYPPILSVHDEGIAEVPQGVGSTEEYEAIMRELPDWAAGCPVAAEAWRGERYRK